MYKDILYEVDGPAAVVTSNRPGSLNAFTQLMLVKSFMEKRAPNFAPLQAD